ncbi:hypothetical protein HD806DRAFT_537879 [Xylariaceae sp. AK1471]|nr:hypothetical protein HD806DRAFT_537879 [Xylariaceae sp. AK1471]
MKGVSTYNVIEAAFEHWAQHIIIASSETFMACFGEGDIADNLLLLSEDEDVNFVGSYVVSKFCSKRVTRGFSRRLVIIGIHALRISNVIEKHVYERNFPKHVEQPETKKRNA